MIENYNTEERKKARRDKRKPELLPNFSYHNLKHTFCTRCCENETDFKAIQEIMGHANIETTMDVYNESNMKRKKVSFTRFEAISEVFLICHFFSTFGRDFAWYYVPICRIISGKQMNGGPGNVEINRL